MSTLKRYRTRATARLHGRLSTSAVLSELVGWGLAVAAALPIGSPASRRARLLTACRRARSRTLRAVVRRQLQPLTSGPGAEVWREHRIGWGRYRGDFGEIDRERDLTTSLVLKAPGPDGEKGVLYCSFEYNWMRLLANHDARAVLADYFLVGSSSWSPPDFVPAAAFSGLSEDPLFICISNLTDMEALAVARPVVEPVPILAGDWVDPDAYVPGPHGERTIDLLMVAHWAPFKRHWLLWTALRRMRRDLRVVLVGRELPGRTTADLLDEARAFGVKQELETVLNVPFERVAELQCDARASAVFSAREGSCVAVAESLFAGAPVAMIRGAHVGSTAYINPQTGIMLSPGRIASELERFLEESGTYEPRTWALRNIGCHRASQRLNAVLRDHSLRTGRPWTRDIEPMCWRYVPDYVHPAAHFTMDAAVRDLRDRHGVRIVTQRAPAAAAAGGA
jgi:hypothetical protein